MFAEEGNFQFFSPNKENLIMSLYHEEISQIDDDVHSHQFAEVFLVAEGSATVEVNQKNFKVFEGDVLFFDSMIPHRIASIVSDAPLVVMSLMLDLTTFITDEYKIFIKKDLKELFNKTSTGDFKIPAESKTASKIHNTLLDIENEFLDTKDKNVLYSYVFLLLAHLIQYNKTKYHDNLLDINPYSAEIEKTMVYINQNLDKNLTLEEIAHIASMNKTYFSTIFKKVTGKTVWEYILNARVERAISYLTKNDDEFNITEILNMCGFNNATSFNKTFKKFTGQTPSEYKKSKYNSCFSK